MSRTTIASTKDFDCFSRWLHFNCLDLMVKLCRRQSSQSLGARKQRIAWSHPAMSSRSVICTSCRSPIRLCSLLPLHFLQHLHTLVDSHRAGCKGLWQIKTINSQRTDGPHMQMRSTMSCHSLRIGNFSLRSSDVMFSDSSNASLKSISVSFASDELCTFDCSGVSGASRGPSEATLALVECDSVAMKIESGCS